MLILYEMLHTCSICMTGHTTLSTRAICSLDFTWLSRRSAKEWNHNLYGVYMMIWCIWRCSRNNSYPSIFIYMMALFYSLIFVLWSPVPNGPYRCSLLRISGGPYSTDPGPGLAGVSVPLAHTGAFCGWAASWAARQQTWLVTKGSHQRHVRKDKRSRANAVSRNPLIKN